MEGMTVYKMKRWNMIWLLAATLLFLAGCGQQIADFDVRDLAQLLLEEMSFDDELTEISLDTAAILYDFGDIAIEDSIIYESSGATAEEIVVLKCGSGQDADAAKEIFEERIKEQKETFEDYAPAEVARLNTAVATVRGNYAILCVSSDKAQAKRLINSLALRKE